MYKYRLRYGFSWWICESLDLPEDELKDGIKNIIQDVPKIFTYAEGRIFHLKLSKANMTELSDNHTWMTESLQGNVNEDF